MIEWDENTRVLKLHGDVPSKKNSKRRVQRGKNIFMVPSAAHEAWHDLMMLELRWWKYEPLEYAKVHMVFYPSSARRSDLSNKAESVMDLLVDIGALKDDNWFVVPDLHLKLGGIKKKNPYVAIKITT